MKISNLAAIIQSVNSAIQNSGITKNTNILNEFSRNIWDSIDDAINLKDCDTYTFDSEEEDSIDNPFTIDSGCMYSIIIYSLLVGPLITFSGTKR